MIYLDNASTTRIDNRVLDAMLPYLQDNYGNPGNIHALGIEASKAVETARKQVAELINCDPSHIIFTSGGSEANNLAINSAARHGSGLFNWGIVSAAEHDSIYNCAADKCIRKIAPVDKTCHVSVEQIDRFINDSLNNPENTVSPPAFVAAMYVNNETGAVNDVKSIAKICNSAGVDYVVDCVQAAGIQKIDVQDIGCSFATISSHKIHGPKGVGALYCRDMSIEPLIFGGENQEFGYRGGTENVAGIVGFGKACSLVDIEAEQKFVPRFRSLFYDILARELGGLVDVKVNGEDLNRGCGRVLNITIEGIDAQTLVLAMSKDFVFISAGSACHSKSVNASRILTSMGLTYDEALSSIRISFSLYNTKSEVVSAAKIMATNVKKLAGSR